MPQVPTRHAQRVGGLLPSTNYEPQLPKKLPELPGVTITIVRPYKQARAQAELARTKAGPELTVRVNKFDKALIEEGAALCGLAAADYARQCAIHTAQAIKAQLANEQPSDPAAKDRSGHEEKP